MSQPPAMKIGDIYYVLFRHKWRIVLCTLAGMGLAVAAYFMRPPPFVSDAKLFVRYVVTQNNTPGARSEAERILTPDQRGETIMDSEGEILTSLDLAKQVAQTIGPEKILAKMGGGNNLNFAAEVIRKSLTVEAPPHSSVIHLRFQHIDPEVVQPVLKEVIDQYLKMHLEIHRANGMIRDYLTQETDTLRAQLAQTEEELRKARAKAGVVSIDDSKKAYSDQIALLRQEIFAAQAEFAERSTVYEQLTKRSATTTTTPEAGPAPSSQKTEEYRNLALRLDQLHRRETDLLGQFTEENSRVKDVRVQIADADAAKQKLETEFPSLVRTIVVTNSATSNAAPGAVDPVAEAARLNALQTKIKVLNSQLDQIRADLANIDQAEGAIQELIRKKNLQETNYRFMAASLEQDRINEALGVGKVSNISRIQEPSPPLADRMKLLKLLGSIVVGGLGFGLAWAFVIELVLDRSVRRPVDIERIPGLPLFLSIPELDKREQKRLAAEHKLLGLPESQQDNGSGDKNLVPLVPPSSPKFGPATVASFLGTFHETLRDRLIGYFESRNLTHKPKLVAVTGLGRSAGVTTTAAGLASSLSQTGEGNVLLVDMTAGQGSAQQFYRGKEVCGLEQVLTTRNSAQIEDNLYVVSEEPSGDKLSRILPQRFTKLVPKLKASNFDYIIFDMPPVSQISITPRLAGFMDMVLLVVESEKTDRDLLQRAIALLGESKAHVGAVLNKTHNYLPARLNEDV